MINESLKILIDFFDQWTTRGDSWEEFLDTLSNALPYWQQFIDKISVISYFVPWQHIRFIMTIAILGVLLRSFLALWKALPLT